MNGTPGKGCLVRTAWLAEANVWVWELVDASNGAVLENSWPAHWAGYSTRELAESAGAARLREIGGVSDPVTHLSRPAPAPRRDGSVAGDRPAGRSVLIIVPRSRVDLYQSLKRSFADDAKAEVVLDRRFKERRVRTAEPQEERRTSDRRCRPEIDAQVKAGQWVTVPLVGQPVDFSDPDARGILFICCSQHVVRCQKCQNTYRLGGVPRTDPGRFLCPLCGFDITATVSAHTESCAYWVSRGANSNRKPSPGLDRGRPVATTATG